MCQAPELRDADSTTSLLRALRKSHPREVASALDEAVVAILQKLAGLEGRDGEADKQALLAVMSTAFSGTDQAPVADKSTTLFLALESPDPETRLAALSDLAALCEQFKRRERPGAKAEDDNAMEIDGEAAPAQGKSASVVARALGRTHGLCVSSPPPRSSFHAERGVQSAPAPSE